MQDEHLCAATTEGNSPLENNSIKGWCDNRLKSNTIACYSAELDSLAALHAAYELTPDIIYIGLKLIAMPSGVFFRHRLSHYTVIKRCQVYNYI